MGLSPFVIADPTKCVGCRACELACFAKHSNYMNNKFTIGCIEEEVIPRLFLVKEDEFCVPVQCRHCEDAPCKNSCPQGAIKNNEEGIYVEQQKCIGCKNCVVACPFGAIEISKEIQTAYKCDLCMGEEPACIKSCPNRALKKVNPFDQKKEKQKKAAESINLLWASFK